jgi:hypothetical protein
MVARILVSEKAGVELLDYVRRHPLALHELIRFRDYHLDGSEADTRALEQAHSMVAFHPGGSNAL